MKIGIDISLLCLPKTGIGHYKANLLDALFAQQQKSPDAQNFELLLYGFNYRLINNFSKLGYPVENLLIKKIPNRLLGLLWSYVSAPKVENFIDDCDLLHLSETSFQPTNKPSVATIHDLTIEKFPEMHTAQNRFFANKRHQRLAQSKSYFVAVSEHTKNDFIEYYQVESERIRVIHHGVAPYFNPQNTNDQLLTKKYNLYRPYFLYLGTLEPRKNLIRLIKAFKEFKNDQQNQLELVIAGKKGWQWKEIFTTVEKLQLQNELKFLGYVAEQDKPALINGAEAFLYPSLYEGFGLPVLEAMACGKAVVTSKNSSLSEIAGDAAILVNPAKITELAAAMTTLIKQPDLKAALAAKAIIQAKKFSWQKSAAAHLAFYRDILD